MKNNLKKSIIVLVIFVAIILLDTLQAQIFKRSPLISTREKLEDNDSWVDKGILINTYYCKEEQDTITVHLEPKKSKFTCSIYNGIEEKINENLTIINELNIYIQKLSYSNFEYTYNIKIDKYDYNYNGIKYDDLYKGTYKGLNTKVKYQIEKNTCYNLSTKKEIFNPHYNVNIGYINLNHLSEILRNESTVCTKNENEFDCNSIDNNVEIKLKFDIENEIIKKINITDNNSFKYSMQYSNIDNVNSIKRIIDYSVNFDLFFEETNEIISKEVENFGTFTLYNVSEVIFINNNKKIKKKESLNSKTLEDFLRSALFKIEKNNSKKYIYQDNFIVYVSKNVNEQLNVYVSLEKYNNDILKEIQKKMEVE